MSEDIAGLNHTVFLATNLPVLIIRTLSYTVFLTTSISTTSFNSLEITYIQVVYFVTLRAPVLVWFA